MNFEIGKIVKVKGVDVLVLDMVNNNPFVIALDTDIESVFSKNSNNYRGSSLERAIRQWLKESGIPTIARRLDLTTMDGSKCYGAMMTNAAPLTFDEWRKYAEIIIPHIKSWLWLATGWSDPKWKNQSGNRACVVYSDGGTSYSYYGNTGGGAAPAFIIDVNFLEREEKISKMSIVESISYLIEENEIPCEGTISFSAVKEISNMFEHQYLSIPHSVECSCYPNMEGGVCSIAWIEDNELKHTVFDYTY